jgi:hypothetical protein
LKIAEDVVPKAARECYRWLLCPSLASSTATQATVEFFPLNTSSAALGAEIERVSLDQELVIGTWSPIHLRERLKELYWKENKPAASAMAFWEDTLRYLYLPRLKNRNVLEQAIVKGAGTRDFFGTAYGEHEGKFDGFKFGDANVQLDETLLLIEPQAAACYAASLLPLPAKPATGGSTPALPLTGSPPTKVTSAMPGQLPGMEGTGSPKAQSFHGNVSVNSATAKMRLVQISEEIIAVLVADPNADVNVSVEIQANFPNGAKDQTKRAVSENTKTLGFKNADWET